MSSVELLITSQPESSVSRRLLDSQCYVLPSVECWATDPYIALNRGQYRYTESALLSQLSSADSPDSEADQLWLLCQLYSHQLMPRSCIGLVHRLSNCVGPTDSRLRQLVLQTARLRQHKNGATPAAHLKMLTDSKFPHLDIEISAALLRQGDIASARIALERSNTEGTCENIMLQAQMLQMTGNQEQAETLLLKSWKLHKHRLDYSLQVIEILFALRRGDTCLPALKQATIEHRWYASPLLERFAQAKILQRQPGVALRLKLQERLPILAGAIVSQPTVLAAIYDNLGRSDWLSYLPKAIDSETAHYPELHTNRLMHLSSRCSSQYQTICKQVVELHTRSIAHHVAPLRRRLRASSIHRLRVGWICADIANHPVPRFLLSWLASAADQLSHEHLVIGIAPSDPRYEQLFRKLSNAQYLDYSQADFLGARIERLRSLHLDVAVDLNGWTGNHIAAAFIARVAPLQLNYLAYHASTGIPTMDYWVVDHHVVEQEPCTEWHSESLLRLPRPFLAWQPHPELPEARAQVATATFPPSTGIRFGCFNHLRKISDEALRCWAQILNTLPNAKLVLKAHSTEDTATATLLQRRLERSGLPLQHVIWLPYTATPDDHLQQYGQMDVALDSFPNTGCTTTCEALWMGVPVITLQGSHYVSRMAAAVLRGTGLQEWICDSTSAYEKLAIEQAEPQRLAWLRENRHHWRRQLQQSPLGDARDLMQQLESAFTDLAQRQLVEQNL